MGVFVLIYLVCTCRCVFFKVKLTVCPTRRPDDSTSYCETLDWKLCLSESDFDHLNELQRLLYLPCHKICIKCEDVLSLKIGSDLVFVNPS